MVMGVSICWWVSVFCSGVIVMAVVIMGMVVVMSVMIVV